MEVQGSSSVLEHRFVNPEPTKICDELQLISQFMPIPSLYLVTL